MCLHEPALCADSVLQASAGNVEGVTNHDVGIVEPLAIDGNRLVVGDGDAQLYADRVFVLVPVRHVDERPDGEGRRTELPQPICTFLDQLFERRRMRQPAKRHGTG